MFESIGVNVVPMGVIAAFNLYLSNLSLNSIHYFALLEQADSVFGLGAIETYFRHYLLTC